MNQKIIHNDLILLANEETAEHSQRFFKTEKGEYGENDIFLGIRVPVLRKLVNKYRGISLVEVSKLLHSKFHEERLLAVLILVHLFKNGFDTLDESETYDWQKQIYNLYLDNIEFINNWDIVDISAGNIVGAYLHQKDKALLYRLVYADNLWERRISIISTFYFFRQN